MMIWETKEIRCDQLHGKSIEKASIELYVARFDQVHPVVSGNKLFKLHYFLEKAITEKKRIVTFGGPYSNHLAATAYACKELAIPCTGIINGEHHQPTSTLKQCASDGMILKFISPEKYRELKTGMQADFYADDIVIPEGGYHLLGAKGASLMPDRISKLTPTHTCLSVGTATTLAGFLSKSSAKVIAVPAIKNMTDIYSRLQHLQTNYAKDRLDIWNEYHFGGFAKSSPDLLKFMKTFQETFGIELDRVYTAKMMWGVLDKIATGYFPAGSKVVCVHTGGLQGNSG